MQQRLFNGQIQPQARPLSAFLQPAQNNIAGPTVQPQLQSGRGIVTQQQAGTSSVAGFNQMQQIADALGPLSTSLKSAVNKGFRQYAINNIEDGYYDELKNQVERAKLQQQLNKEAGAADAAGTVTALSKVDPAAGELAREANPWRAVGRNRALTQLAAAELSTVFDADMAQNAGLYAGMQPGSGELMERKQQLTRRIFDKYELTGDETEVAYYFLPELNKTWDKFTAAQSKLYSAELSESQVAATSASVSNVFTKFNADGGIVMRDGTVLQPGRPGYAEEGAAQVTNAIDSGLALLGGKDKVDALERIRKQLGYWAASGTAGALDIVQNVRLGPAFDAKGNRIKLENRPRYAEAFPMELTDNTAAALQSRNELNSKTQTALETQLRQLWFDPENGPGAVSPQSPEYRERFARWRQTAVAVGAQDPDGLGSSLADEQRQTNESIISPTTAEYAQALSAFQSLKPSDLDSPEKIDLLRYRATNLALMLSAGDTSSFRSMQKELFGNIDDAQKRFGGVAANLGLQGNLTRFVKEDLDDPKILALAGNARFSIGADGQVNIAGGKSEYKQQITAFGNRSREMYQAKFNELSEEWWNSNPSAPEMPLSVAQGLLTKAKNEVRRSQEWQQLRTDLVGEEKTKKPNQPGSSVKQDQQKPVQYGSDSASSATSTIAKEYTSRLVMTPNWLQQELNGYSTNGYFSTEMNGLATKADTSSLVYIRRQMDFIDWQDATPAQLDLWDKWKAYLDQQINIKKTSSLPARTNFEYAANPSAATYNPRSPGAWLMAELFPTAA